MWKRIIVVTAVGLFLVSSVKVEGARRPGIVRMKIAEFRPQESVPSFWRYGLERKTPLRDEDYYLVQFEGAVREHWKDEIREYGGRFWGFIPNYCFVVKLPRDRVEKIRALPYVLWVGEFKPAYRISPRLVYENQESEKHYDRRKGKWIELDEPGTVQLMVQTFKDEDFESLIGRIKAMEGVEIVNTAQSAYNAYFDHIIVKIPARRAKEIGIELASQPEVHWVERYHIPRLLNDWSRWIHQSYDTLSMKPLHDRWSAQMEVDSAKTPIFHWGLYGAGEIIGYSDTGLDFDHSAFRDATLVTFDNPGTHFTGITGHRKLVGYQDLIGGPGTVDDGRRDEHDHGTHVGGSIAGDSLGAVLGGSMIFATGDGMAPRAKLAKQDISSGGVLSGIPTDLNDLYRWAYNGGARLHSNSWGSSLNNYTTDALNSDMFMWNNRDMLIFFATGNANDDAVPDRVGSPATAKNMVSVGASESGAGDGTTYQNPGHPGRNDLEDAAEFSSKGPTDEGLHKPNLMACGGWFIWSADSDLSTTTNNYGVRRMGGTSMACPMAAGLAALVREYFRRGFYPDGVETPANAIDPTGDLVKAMLINSTRNMTGAFTADAIGTGTAGSGSNAAPSQGQGWGRIVLDDVLHFSGEERHLQIERDSLSTGQTHTYTVTTGPSATEYIKIVLVWTDRWGMQTASDILVNDLDLEVTVTGGPSYRGSIFPYNSPRSTPNPTTRDNTNPQEVVWLDPLPNTTLTITVTGTEINWGPQPYALVITGNIPGAVNVPPGMASLNKLFNYELTPSTTPTFDWNVPSDLEGEILHFRLQWDEDVNFGSPVTIGSRHSTTGFSPAPPVAPGTGTCSYTVNSQSEGELVQDSTYWWRVSAWDGTSYGHWSEKRSLTVDTNIFHSAWYIGVGSQWENCTRSGLAIEGDSVLLRLATTTLLDEGFEGTTFPPAGWSQWAGPDNDSPNAWIGGNFYPPHNTPFGSQAALIQWDSWNFTNRSLGTPSINLVGYTSATLSFALVRSGALPDTMRVEVSTDGGGTWTEIAIYHFGNTNQIWTPLKTVDLSSYLGQSDVRIAFRYTQLDGSWGGIDRVIITGGAVSDSGTIKSPPIVFTDFPANRASWGKVFWNKRLAADSIGMRVEKRSAGSWVTAISDTFIMTTAVCTLDLLSLGTTDTIRLVGRFYRTTVSTNPVLKDWSVTYRTAPLSVELTNFWAEAQIGQVNLSWRVAGETDNLKWLLVRREDETAEFVNIAEIRGRRTTPQETTYVYIDENVSVGETYYYKLGDIDSEGDTTWHGPIKATPGGPRITKIERNYPNPFIATTHIKYQIARKQPVLLKIYDISGRVVRTLVDGPLKIGYYRESWDGKDNRGRKVASGIYFLRFDTEDHRKTFKLIKISR